MATQPVPDKYAGRPIKKRIVNLGIGGTIELPPQLLGAEPRSRVTFTVAADLGAIKHKFEKDGSVTEATILTVDGGTLAIVSVAAGEAPVQQPELDENTDDDD